jgi:hypothetical protein
MMGATGEAEIKKTAVPGWHGQKSLRDPISMEESWEWQCMPFIPIARIVVHPKNKEYITKSYKVITVRNLGFEFFTSLPFLQENH